jgi:phage terminase large subunit-like protein
VYPHGDRLALGSGRIWRPTPTDPLDIEATVEQYLDELARQYAVTAMYCDPFQLHRSLTTLAARGLPITEFPQSPPHLTRMAQALFELLTGHNLALYDAPELRAHALNAVCVESSRGLRLAKEKSSRKIDGLVALAMAAVAALDTPRAEPSPFPPSGTPGPSRIAAFGWDGTPVGRLSRVDWNEPW